MFGAVLTLLGTGAVRFQSQLFSTRRPVRDTERRRVLIVGAGAAGSMILKDLLRSPSLGLRPVGLIDDDRRKVGRRLHGVPVHGPIAAMPRLVKELQGRRRPAGHPLGHQRAGARGGRRPASGPTPRSRSCRACTRRSAAGSPPATSATSSIEDLLGRQQVDTDLDAVKALLRGRRVLITGAGGSIGSEIARQVASFGPASLVLLDHDETHLHDVVMSLDEFAEELTEATGVVDLATAEMQLETVLADIRDRERVFGVFVRHRPEIVFHAAAHKHVPVLEEHPAEALATNVLGTANLADAAVANGVGHFVLISTDKAINPVSVMGTSKWLAEQVVRSLQNGHSVLCAVRFGNVLGSRGSVIPTFFRQIARGGPVTVTDARMTRYFMSVQEAVQLVLQAAALSTGGEVFTLDMGEPVRILDVAERLIRLSGRIPGRDVPIVITGVRPGEKMAEDIVAPDEEQVPSGHPAIVVSRPPVPDRAVVHRALAELEYLSFEGTPAELASRMKRSRPTRWTQPRPRATPRPSKERSAMRSSRCCAAACWPATPGWPSSARATSGCRWPAPPPRPASR